ncbi:DDE-type integrase/transposase/recombinase [Aetokthonos hydrillicola Thurmond2011]|jgi:putative transposase|uniref:DDE-type integrase/transposase/recombinase n=1 Tax=Aetokthonos hydrillicola Thurmond2011 TaxID=2712845 RepID=A0AAP5IEZ2_9CYAN|nr:Mu transposase C-terminal domain-containing protein [Aetokthonos hydrillicola]MBO3461555.1 transposase [Aetokthonos hydrillicola CCALA 1050]MBW4586143.1 DDE-type integrase/transposase/recombinase [Aetokthonos hydrillicola CCALA 1050]MDR9897750.1 DDE-type integrase/transposase/recombinase [Aetokthonos hydrillicola Thurmond2011]
MKRIQLRNGLHFWLHGREYVIKQRLAGGNFQICDVVTEVLSKIKETSLIQLIFQGELELELTQSTGDKSRKTDYRLADFTQIPEELRLDAKRKYSYISCVLELDLQVRTKATLQPVIEKVSSSINDPNPPTWLTLYRWLKTYLNAGQDIRALVPRHFSKGDYRPKLHKEVIYIIDRVIQSIYLDTSQPDVADVYDEILRQITHENQTRAMLAEKPLKIPHRSTIYRIISRLPPLTVATGRYGKRIAEQMYNPVLSGPRPTRPLERVEIDHTKLNLFVVDTENRLPIGRPWLTSAVDKYSGVTLGYYLSFDPPSYLSVMQCLLHAISPKNYLHAQFKSVENTWDTYGLPEVIVVDNGKEFYSTHFEDACLQLGIIIQYCPPKMPWYKSTIERYFGALNSQLLSDQPGKSFSNFMKQYDYDPLKNAVISFEALQEIIHIFIVDIHNQSSHPELKAPRSKVWSLAIEEFPPALPPSNQELFVLIGSITTRKITRRGVELFGIIYNSSELASLHSMSKEASKTTVKYDPTDLSQIYVFDQITRQFKEVPALNQEYTLRLSLWQHQVIKQLARIESEQVDIVALALAKEKIQRIVEREWSLSKNNKTRTSLARWKGTLRNNFLTENLESSQQVIRNDTDKVDTFSSTKSVMTGISDLGSAFNDYPANQVVDSNAFSTEIKSVDNSSTQVDGLKSASTSIQKKRQRRTSKKLTTSVEEKVSDSLAETAEWKPDLAGWDVSIGLPLGE